MASRRSAVTSGKLTAGAVGAAAIADGSVTTEDLAAAAVTAAKLADGAVGPARATACSSA